MDRLLRGLGPLNTMPRWGWSRMDAAQRKSTSRAPPTNLNTGCILTSIQTLAQSTIANSYRITEHSQILSACGFHVNLI